MKVRLGNKYIHKATDTEITLGDEPIEIFPIDFLDTLCYNTRNKGETNDQRRRKQNLSKP